jgi:hypothetical protein
MKTTTIMINAPVLLDPYAPSSLRASSARMSRECRLHGQMAALQRSKFAPISGRLSPCVLGYGLNGLPENAMKRPARLLLASFLTTAIVSVSGFVTGAEGVATQQELVNVKTAKQVFSAVWTRQPDSYTLQVVFDRSMPTPGVKVEVRDALKSVPQNVSQPIPNWEENAPSTADRASFFIGNTIEKLRGLDPVFCGRTLSLVDGRRPEQGQQAQAPARTPVRVPLPPGFRDTRVEVWLLNAGGTQIQNATYDCDFPGKNSPSRAELSVSYGFTVADGAQAVAAAIRIGDDFYIEKLQPLAAAPAIQ